MTIWPSQTQEDTHWLWQEGELKPSPDVKNLFLVHVADLCTAAQSENWPGGRVCGRTRQQEPVQV